MQLGLVTFCLEPAPSRCSDTLLPPLSAAFYHRSSHQSPFLVLRREEEQGIRGSFNSLYQKRQTQMEKREIFTYAWLRCLSTSREPGQPGEWVSMFSTQGPSKHFPLLVEGWRCLDKALFLSSHGLSWRRLEGPPSQGRL